MNWKSIDIQDKAIFDKYFLSSEVRLSDFTFTNLFIWRSYKKIEYVILKDFLCIKISPKGEDPFIFPPFGKGDLKGVMEELIAYFENNRAPFSIHSVDKTTKESLTELFGTKLFFGEMRDKFDYVYSVEDLIRLEGKKFHTKKNHINFFKENYKYSYEDISHSNITKVKSFMNEWCNYRQCSMDALLAHEYAGIISALDNFDALNIGGGAILIDKKVVAFSLAEQLNKDTVVIHIEKGDNETRGSYPIINQEFLIHKYSNLKYVNREEDLGLEGLRKAKLSYNPIRLEEKYFCTLAST